MFSASEINTKRIELSREKNEAVLIAILAFCLWLLPLTKRSPIWVDLVFRFLAVGNAAVLVRRADDISRQEQLLGAQIHVSRQLLQKYINVQAYQEEQAIVAPIMPPPPELPPGPQYQLTEGRSQQRSAQPQKTEGQHQERAIATRSRQWDEDPEVELIESTTSHPGQEDLGSHSLFELIYTNHKRHLLLPAETGAGKTTILLGAIDYINTVTSGNAEFFGSTAKVSPWLGLEDEIAEDGLPRIINLSFDRPETILALIQRLKWLVKKGEARQQKRTECEKQSKAYNPKPLYMMLDEWIRSCAIAQKFDRINKTKIFEELVELVEHFLLVGREDEMIVWLLGQDHQVQNNHINTGFRKSFGIVVPGVYGNMQGIEDALMGRSPLVTPDRKKSLFAEAERLAKENTKVPIAYCNIDGHNIISLPYLPDIKRKRVFGGSSTGAVRPTQEPHQDIPRKAPPESDDPYAYRYPPNWRDVSHLTKVLTGKVCCYPECTNQATETHHAYYQDNQGRSICNDPEPGEHVFGLCDDHHSDRSNLECAHHPNNWIKGERKDFLEIDSRNTREYHQLLKQGWQEKLIYANELAA